MKRLISFIIMLLAVLTIQAGIFYTRKASGIVYYTDGHKKSFKTITIPYAGDKKFKAIDESGKKVTIKSIDVEHLELWNPDYPEASRDVLWCCADTKANGTKKFLAWCFVAGQGKYISFFTHEGKYIMRKDGLAMVIRNTSPGPTLICIKPAVSNEYEYVGVMGILEFASKKLTKKLVEKFIYDDPTLCKSLQEKNWKGQVYELLDFVAGAYNPQK